MPEQYFSPVTSSSTELSILSRILPPRGDGILGLAFPAMSGFPGAPFVNNAFSKGMIKEESFDLRILSNGVQELYLGGVRDPNMYEGSFEKHPVDKSQGKWDLRGASIYVGNVEVVSNVITRLDSGSELIYATPAAVDFCFALTVTSSDDSPTGQVVLL